MDSLHSPDGCNVLREASAFIIQDRNGLVALLQQHQNGAHGEGVIPGQAEKVEEMVSVLQSLITSVSELVDAARITGARASLSMLKEADSPEHMLPVASGHGNTKGDYITSSRTHDGVMPQQQQCSSCDHELPRKPTACSQEGVIASIELLMHILSYGTKSDLCASALACRAWRDAAHGEVLWEPLAKALVPRLAKASAVATRAQLEACGGSYRRFIMRYGRVLLKRVVERQRSLVLQFDVWVGDTLLVSDEGEVEIRCAGNIGEHHLIYSESSGRVPLSGADDSPLPKPHRWLEDPIMHVNARVMVHDTRSGKTTILWNDPMTQACNSIVHEDEGHLVQCCSDSRELTTVPYGPSVLLQLGFSVDCFGSVEHRRIIG